VHLLALPSWHGLGSSYKGILVASPPAKPASAPAQQARLVLQDPLARSEDQVPALRLSRELGSVTESGLDRDATQQIWEALQLKPEEIIAGRAQLREANGKVQAATLQVQAARAEAGQLQAKLQHLQQTRWQHPVVYGAGAALLGVGWLWLSERKKRMAAQEHAAMLLTEDNSVLAMPEGPPSISEPAAIEARPSFTSPPAPAAPISPVAQPISDPIAESITPEDLLPYIAPEKAIAPVFAPPTPWWKFSKRKPARKPVENALSGGSLGSTDNEHSTQIQIPHADEPYEGTTELEDMHAPDVPAYDIELANVELLTQTRLKPASSEDAMGHLLEIRMAVQALAVLGKPSAALKLLAQHIDEVPNTCAWAYMEYLDLSSNLGERDAFEAMRKRYRLQFNRLAPYWMEPNGSVQSLDSYERPMAELCAVWPSLDRAKILIATWLQGTLHARRLFQRPAYHDLFDLYEMLEFFDDQSPAAQDFVPTVSLLDLDYEFAVEVKIEARTNDDAMRAVPTVKTGDFDVDFNLAQGATEMGALTPVSATPKTVRPL
jgi:hypothetical protein